MSAAAEAVGEKKPTRTTITAEMEDDISAALNAPSTVTLVSAFQINITRKDIDTLKTRQWLNDEVINFYLQMIAERSKDNNNLPNVYAFNTFFYPKIWHQVRIMHCKI